MSIVFPPGFSRSTSAFCIFKPCGDGTRGHCIECMPPVVVQAGNVNGETSTSPSIGGSGGFIGRGRGRGRGGRRGGKGKSPVSV